MSTTPTSWRPIRPERPARAGGHRRRRSLPDQPGSARTPVATRSSPHPGCVSAPASTPFIQRDALPPDSDHGSTLSAPPSCLSPFPGRRIAALRGTRSPSAHDLDEDRSPSCADELILQQLVRRARDLDLAGHAMGLHLTRRVHGTLGMALRLRPPRSGLTTRGTAEGSFAACGAPDSPWRRSCQLSDS
jgi:hypothetical protein